jgi:hypothetical protein
MLSRRLLLLGIAGFLAGCVTIPPPALEVDSIRALKIVDVKVEGIGVVNAWPAEEEVYIRNNAVDAETAHKIRGEPARNFPAVRVHLETALTERMKLELANQVGPVMQGGRAVRAVVRLRSFDVPSMARRILIDQTAKLDAGIDLVDPASGAVVLSYAGAPMSRMMPGGLGAPIFDAIAGQSYDAGKLILADFVTRYREWLLRT